MVYWLGLAVPFAYLSILIGSLATFSSLYRKRQAAKSTNLEPWFGPHIQRDIYLSLLHTEPDSQPGQTQGQEKSPPAIPDSVLKAALLQRAVEDIRRILSLRSAKPALSNLLQKGSVGDELWQRLVREEKDLEEEVRDVATEANALSSNWGNIIFQSANEMFHNQSIRDKVAELQAQGKSDREWWDQKRATIQSDFMKELNDQDKTTTGGAGGGGGGGSGAGATTTTPATTTATTGSTSTSDAPPSNLTKSPSTQGEKVGVSVGSDEDTVLVEGGGPATSGSASGSAKGGAMKKRKGKK